MKRQEVAALLTVVSSYDRRTLGETDVIAWHGALGDLRFDECRDAVVSHYATQTDWLMPAHVRRIALAARQDTAMRELPAAPALPLPIPGAPPWVREVYEAAKTKQHEINRRRKADGQPPTFGETVMSTSDGRRAS